ncbi:YqaA family protein [Moraxella pluranimalium]|uniref:VTT domain-containing protein n=1 Tax=Moraxella pluranimalium TaxID=470453 RepID=A0A1T0CF10_9GAMM|nr:YqaA family protein [Moraxella pluranimalium]OOS20947.1 hypothetical protein B0680_10225 [Moraxella pluranimalium]
MAYLNLFLSAFLAATLLPAQSEAMLLYLLGSHPAWALIGVASVGNILGSCVNFWLGLHIHRFSQHRYFPFKPEQITNAERHYHRYGVYSLLLSWLPIIGDPLTLIAGMMRERFWRFLLLVSIAKTTRYALLYLIWLGVM